MAIYFTNSFDKQQCYFFKHENKQIFFPKSKQSEMQQYWNVFVEINLKSTNKICHSIFLNKFVKVICKNKYYAIVQIVPNLISDYGRGKKFKRSNEIWCFEVWEGWNNIRGWKCTHNYVKPLKYHNILYFYTVLWYHWNCKS